MLEGIANRGGQGKHGAWGECLIVFFCDWGEAVVGSSEGARTASPTRRARTDDVTQGSSGLKGGAWGLGLACRSSAIWPLSLFSVGRETAHGRLEVHEGMIVSAARS